ncbi:hypothetical protein CI109_105017 [Kwoniella shandongensis]|uniref:Protein-lysine N-methyltransferase EFM6 n=1 Tax=Kwoniella shandongensis TaxID=1734106 RepID=A0A5M6BWV7_9TREE|nr:uncharacterized protein CI109_004384 [Kwoniella shandongensis]KAA5527324.1 hypothetical protein CI109_004384 [Kwoniella shandongensis]
MAIASPGPSRIHSRAGSFSSSTSSSTPLPSFEGLAPSRPPTTIEKEETRVIVPGLPGGRDVRLKVDAGPGCGGIAWRSGEVMSRYLAHRHATFPEKLRGKKIIELGSGTGLVGIATAMLEPTSQVWVTDQEMLLDLMQANSELNLDDLDGENNVHVAELSWGEPIHETIPVEEASIILAADCVYFEPAFPLLVTTLCDLAPVGKDIEILFCWKKRRKADKRFFAMLRKHFDQEMVLDDREGEKELYSREGITLMRLKRRI